MSKSWRSPAVIISLVVGLAVALSLLAGVFLTADRAEAKINIPTGGSGTDYYVDAVNGDDINNNGTSWLDAWKTITHAANTVLLGDSATDPNIIHVASGTYDATNNNETFPITFNEENVTLMADYLTTVPVIDGEGTGTILEIKDTGIIIYGFTIKNGGRAIEAYCGGFGIANNTFSDTTDWDIGYGVHVYFSESDRATDFSFDSIVIEDNVFCINDIGVLLSFNLDFKDTLTGLDTTIGDIDILDNDFYMHTTEGVTINVAVEDVDAGTVTVGDIDISDGNTFTNGDYGVDFDSYLHNLNNATVNIGDLTINGNTFTDQTTYAVYIGSYYDAGATDYDSDNWRGTTAVTIGNIKVNGNDISSTAAACRGVYIYQYGSWNYIEDNVTITAGEISIENNNPIDIDGEYAVYVGYYGTEYFRNNAAVTLGDLSIQGNTITSGNYGVFIKYYECGYWMDDYSSATFGDINIEDNEITTDDDDGIYLEMDDLGSCLSDNTQVSLGDVNVLNNNAIDAADHGINLRFGNNCGFGDGLYDDSVFTAGNVNIQGNVVTAGDWMGIHVYYHYAGYELYDSAQFSLGNVTIEENDVTTGTHDGIDVDYAYCAQIIKDDATAQIGNVTISDNGINAGSYGVSLEYDDVGYELSNSAQVSVGTVDINGNHAVGDDMAPMTTGDRGILFFFNDFGSTTHDDSSATFGDITMQDNDIDSAKEGIYLWYCYVGYYMYDSSDVTVGAVDISNNDIDSAHWISAVKIYYDYVAYEMGTDSDPCDATLNLGDISIYDNTIAGDSDGINIEYYDSEVGYYMYDGAHAELPSYTITGNTFNVSGDGIYYYNYDNPYYIYDSSTIDFGGMLIDDNTFNDQDVGMDYGVYINFLSFCQENYGNSTTIVGDFTISNNEFYDLGNDAVHMDYDIGYELNASSLLQIGDLEIADNTIDGAAYGIWVYYEADSWDDSTLTVGNLDITGNNLSNITKNGIYLYYDLHADGNSTQTIGRALIQDNFLDYIIMDNDGIYVYMSKQVEDGAISLGEPMIDRNIIEDWTNGIHLVDVDGATISNNFIKDNLCGIYLGGSTDNINITNNDILKNLGSASGIHLESTCGASNTINYNNIVANSSGDWGIYNASTNVI